MIYCLYNSETNALLGISTAPHAVQLGQAEIAHNRDMPDLTVEEWNPAILNFFTKTDVPITKLKFLDRITAQEYAAFKQAAAVSAEIGYFWQKLMVAEDIVLSDPRLIAGLNALEQAGVLTAGRAAEILA